ncbi:MAG: O-antigen ligase family protein [Armatimonadetes bacterium]|nr:O-antigen ligase family protein [Armatimonadota bacterium]
MILALLALALLLAAVFAAVPDGTPIWGIQAFPAFSAVWNYPDWPAIVGVLVLLAALIAILRGGRGGTCRERTAAGRAEAAFAALLGIALISLLWRLAADRGIAYLGPMLRGWTVLATDFALFALARRAAQGGRLPAYALTLAAVFASAIVAMIGVTEYLTHRRMGDVGWRVFATSTPDFLAGYLVMLLPPTLALYVGIPLPKRRRSRVGFLLAVFLLVAFGYQAFTLLRTQSRFGLVSLGVGLLVFGVALWRAWREGLSLEASSWWRLLSVGVFIALIGLGFAKPLLNRLQQTSTGDNSTAFRLYTWRGSLKMAAANPVLGTGVGTYVHLYPRYAVTGFTRLAHNSYIQMADECGLPGLLALLLTLGFLFAAIGRGLSAPPAPNPGGAAKETNHSSSPIIGGRGAEALAFVAPADDRVLLCGLLGGLSAGAVQNLIDSDWYVFFLGVTFWALAGLAAGLAEAPPAPPESGVGGRSSPAPPESGAGGSTGARSAMAVVAGLILVRMAAQGLAAAYDAQATAVVTNPDADATPVAEQGWAEAAHWDPLNARYPSYMGYRVYFQREGNLPAAESALREAVRLEPSSLNYASLATVLAREGRRDDAVRALQDGLRSDPNSIDLRLTLAQMLPPPQSVAYCRQITALEDGPVGRVRAIGNITEYKFPVADACVADAAFAARDLDQARLYYARASRLLESYADEGGTANPQRQVLIGDRPSPALDAQMRDLYARVMGRRIALAPPAEKSPLIVTARSYAKKYADVINKASQ